MTTFFGAFCFPFDGRCTTDCIDFTDDFVLGVLLLFVCVDDAKSTLVADWCSNANSAIRGSTSGLWAKRTARDGEDTCANLGTIRLPVGISGIANV